jgi:hypothetical protein
MGKYKRHADTKALFIAIEAINYAKIITLLKRAGL